MTDAILTGIFTIVGVIIGGLSSWIIAAYTNKKSRAEKVLEKQQALCLNMLAGLNEMLERLPKSNEDLPAFKTYLLSEFYPKRTSAISAEEMLYLSDDIRAAYLVVCLFAENDFSADCNYDVIQRKLHIHRNIFVEMLREDLKISCEPENAKKKDRRYRKLVKKQIKELQSEQNDDLD